MFVKEDHLFHARDGIMLAELSGQRVIRREPGSTTRAAVERVLAEREVQIEPVLDIGSREGVWKAVEQGLGLAFVARFEFIAHPRLKPIPIIDARIRTNFFVAFLNDRLDARLVRAFAGLARGVARDGSGEVGSGTSLRGTDAGQGRDSSG